MKMRSRPLQSAVAALAILLAVFTAQAKVRHRRAVEEMDSADDIGVTPAPSPGRPAPPELTPEGIPILPPPGTPDLPIAAQGAVAMDEWSGQLLYARNADAPFYPASTTKILTALLIIEAGGLDHIVNVAAGVEKVGESSLELKEGQQYTRRELLYGLMLKSANDAAYALACDNAGSIEAFAEKMNLRAKQLGAVNSHFVNPNGLHDPQHYTTPHDLALIARAAMQQPYFREIVGTQHHIWMTDTGQWDLTNHNRLLHMFPGCTGVKTGYTYPAQQVLVSAALWGTREVIAVVMHTDHPGIWDDSKILLTYGFAHLPAETLQ